MTLDIFDIDDEELLRMNQIEEECGCDVIAGVDHGVDLGNYLRQTMNSISYDQLKAILNSKTGKVFSSEDVDEIVSEIQSQMLITDSEQIPILAHQPA
jgi:hypothetical protein